jgi:hypothetical protein
MMALELEPELNEAARGHRPRGSPAAVWPLAASAQADRARRIGALMNLAENDPESQARLARADEVIE